jgi:uncharacterized protein YceK
LKLKTLLLSLLLLTTLITLSGCGTVLYVIEPTDIHAVEKGKAYTAEKDGWFLSDLYFKQVLKAKVK